MTEIRNLRAIPGTEKELSAVMKIAGPANVKVYSANSLTESTVKSIDFSDYCYVLFATHALVNNYDPGRSYIVLSTVSEPDQDGILQPHEIIDLNITADLVFLSACVTGAGKAYPGEGPISLARPFLTGGCNSVVVTLWSIDDKASVEIVSEFFRQLIDGRSIPEALSEAKRSMLSSERHLYRHPYFWAPFVLIG